MKEIASSLKPDQAAAKLANLLREISSTAPKQAPPATSRYMSPAPPSGTAVIDGSSIPVVVSLVGELAVKKVNVSLGPAAVKM
jgi:hypothetical protein